MRGSTSGPVADRGRDMTLNAKADCAAAQAPAPLPRRDPRRIIAAGLVCISGLCYVLNDSVTKGLVPRYDVSVIIFLRSVMALPLIYAMHRLTRRGTALYSRRTGLHALRGAIGLAAAYLYIRALSDLSVAEATVILFLSPVFITALSAFVLREQVGKRAWASVLLCFCGVVVAIGPSGAGLGVASLLVAASSLLYALNAINARWIPPEDSLWTIAFFGSLFTGLLIAPVAARHWSGLGLADLRLFVAAACFSSLAIGLGALAYRMAAASFLAPFGYSGLIWSISVTWLLWGVAPDAASIAGTAIIFAGAAVAAGNPRRSGGKKQTPP